MKESLFKILQEYLNESIIEDEVKFGSEFDDENQDDEDYVNNTDDESSDFDNSSDDTEDDEPISDDEFENKLKGISRDDMMKYSPRKKENAIEMKKLGLSADEYLYFKVYGAVPKRLGYGQGRKEEQFGHVKYKQEIGKNGQTRLVSHNGYFVIQLANQISYDMSHVKRHRTDKGESLSLMNDSYNNMLTLKKGKGGQNEFVRGVAYTDEVIEMPNGRQISLIKNFGVPGQNIDQETGKRFTYNYIYTLGVKSGIPYGTLFIRLPQSKEFGVIKTRGESKKTVEQMIGYARSNVTDAINYAFRNPELIETLNNSFIAHPVGNYKYAEQSSNVRPISQWGVDGPRIDVQYNSVIGYDQMKNLLRLLENNLRRRGVKINFVDSNEGEKLNSMSDDEDEFGMKNRLGADYMRRFYAGNIYKNGKWYHYQRVGNKEYFYELGGKTKYRRLNPKGIQEGNIQVSSMSTLNITGNVVGKNYVVRVLFNTEIVFNPGDKKLGESYGNVITPIAVVLKEPIPEELINNLTLSDSSNRAAVEFIASKNGVLTRALRKLAGLIQKRALTQQKNIFNHVLNIVEGKAQTTEPLQEQKTKLNFNDIIKDL